MIRGHHVLGTEAPNDIHALRATACESIVLRDCAVGLISKWELDIQDTIEVCPSGFTV